MSAGLHRNRDRVADVGASALASGCIQLQLIDLRDCCEIKDIGVLASVALGCGQLQSINLSNSCKITDIGVSALARGCGQLHSIDPQLQSIDSMECRKIP
jgi:Leucine Rich repeat